MTIFGPPGNRPRTEDSHLPQSSPRFTGSGDGDPWRRFCSESLSQSQFILGGIGEMPLKVKGLPPLALFGQEMP